MNKTIKKGPSLIEKLRVDNDAACDSAVVFGESCRNVAFYSQQTYVGLGLGLGLGL